MLVHVLQRSEMLRELFLRRWKIDRSKNFPRYARKINYRPLRGLYIWPLHSRGPSDALAVYCNSQSSLLHGTKKSAQWNNVMYVPGLWPIESCHTVWGLMPLLLALSGVLPSGQDSSRSHSHRCSLILPQDHDLNYVMLSVCIFVCCIWVSGVYLFSCCHILHTHLGQSDNNLWPLTLCRKI